MIRPVDLQTLFVNMDKVGKEHAQTRENVALAQAAEAKKLLEADDKATHAVIETKSTQEGGDEVKLQLHKDEVPHGKSGKRKKKPDEPEDEPESDNKWKDPELGSHIDISG